MPLTGVKLENFTVFEKLEMDFSPGINVLIGPNGSGKTHLMKVLYSAIRANIHDVSFNNKLTRCFTPDIYTISRLIRKPDGNKPAFITVTGENTQKSELFMKIIDNSASEPAGIYINFPLTVGAAQWTEDMGHIHSTFIPAGEILSHGFHLSPTHSDSVVSEGYMQYDDTYLDVLEAARNSVLSWDNTSEYQELLHKIEDKIGGKVSYSAERDRFYLKSGDISFEFSLVAEGFRKLGLLWRLIQNGYLANGSILFWDEPEANITPSNIPLIVDTLLELQRGGVQIFLATHDYFLCRYFDVKREDTDRIQYHSFFRENGSVTAENGETFEGLSHNAIIDTSINLYRDEVDRVLKE